VIGSPLDEVWAALTAPGRFDFLPQPVQATIDETARELTLHWTDSASDVAFALSAHPSGTLLRLRQAPTPDVDTGEVIRSGPDFAAGWHATVDALVAELAGIPLPEGDALWQAAYAVYSTRGGAR
jgi:hypothetical protein